MVYKTIIPLAVPAQAIGEELERIEHQHGTTTPQRVRDEARDASATLHRCFEWDDSKAAEKYRLHQAASIICNVTVVHDQRNSGKETRAFVNVSSSRGVGQQGAYISIATAMRNDDTREIVLKQAIRELKAARKKYSDYSELADVFAAIDNLQMEA